MANSVISDRVGLDLWVKFLLSSLNSQEQWSKYADILGEMLSEANHIILSRNYKKKDELDSFDLLYFQSKKDELGMIYLLLNDLRTNLRIRK